MQPPPPMDDEWYHTTNQKSSEPKGEGAVEWNIIVLILLMMMDLTVMEIILVHLDENLKFWGDFCPTGRFLGVALVESVDKGSIFGLEIITDR